MAGEGETLRKVREEKGLNYQSIEESTKIRAIYLEALEKEDYGVLPGTTYTRGFLRSYAMYLGVSPQAIVDSYNASLAAATKPAIHSSSSPLPGNQIWFRLLGLAGMAILVLIIVAIFIFV